ncbi:MAG: alpha/beta hydrolase [Mesorhizobium sp.]|uniref:alpha/beta fold hydrolase n=1 Tax=Mesorhizobium sp. TaxID=1871066 RepID=UPI00121C4BF4|nr:alpha/beta hydrolase [Mesorhizobium sp.]TIQ36293.1 MAG: alpha/beta hydrolase [Mesorhizobium sp.]
MAERVTIPVGRLNIAASRAGDAKKPALILLHGWPHSRALYDGVLDALSVNFYVLAPDLPNIGDSNGAPSSAEKTVLADVVLKAAESADAHDILIAGLDVGGMVAFAAARDHSERIEAAVVMNTVIPGLDPWEKLLADPRVWHFAFHKVADLPETLVTGRERAYFDFFHDVLAGEARRIPEALRADFANAYSRPEALKSGFDWYRAMTADACRNAKPTGIEKPLLYMRGDADKRPIEPYLEGLKAAGVSNVHSRIIEGSGELLPIEAPAEFIQALRDFRAGLGTGV